MATSIEMEQFSNFASDKSVTVVIPAFNAGKTIKECILSVYNQTVTAFLIVIDDCSTDLTLKIARATANTHTLVLHNQIRVGKAETINNALNHVPSEYIIILDSDTYLERRFVQKLQSILKAHNYECGAGTVHWIGRDKTSNRLARFRTNRTQRIWGYNGCCQFFKTSILRKEGYVKDCLVEDEEIYWRLRKHRGKIIDAVAHTETPSDVHNLARERLRWSRGAFQLLKQGRLSKTYALSHLFRPIMLLILLGLSIVSVIQHLPLNFEVSLFVMSGIILAWFSLPELIMTKTPKDLIYTLTASFTPLCAFIEVFILKRKYTVKNW